MLFNLTKQPFSENLKNIDEPNVNTEDLLIRQPFSDNFKLNSDGSIIAKSDFVRQPFSDNFIYDGLLYVKQPFSNIWKAGTLIAQGAVAASNTQLSLVDGTAFAYFDGVDLSAYQTGKHLLAVYNSTTDLLIAQGYCSATPPAGETLSGSELLTAWTNTDYDTFTTVGKDITSAINLAGTAVGNSNAITWTSGQLFKLVATLTLNSGTTPIYYYGLGATQLSFRLSAGANTKYRTGVGGAVYDTIYSDAVNNFSLVNSEQQVTDPPSTGVRIVSAKGGATQNWTTKGSGAVNEAITYKIWSLGN